MSTMPQQDADLREQFIRLIGGLSAEELEQVKVIMLELHQEQRKRRTAKASPQARRTA